MLYYVSGTVTILEPGLAVIDCGGVGYGCRVTAYTAGQLKLNQPARLYITESIREDAFDLYGFSSREEQRCYELLTSVNGVGPKAAMAILSSGGPQNFTLAVVTGDEKMLTAAQGIGKKIAQRIILELKDKLKLEDAFEKKLAHEQEAAALSGSEALHDGRKRKASAHDWREPEVAVADTHRREVFCGHHGRVHDLENLRLEHHPLSGGPVGTGSPAV